MSPIAHIAAFLAYAALAGATFVGLPELLPDRDPALPPLVAALVFLTGALFHEWMARREDVAGLRGRLLAQADALTRLREDFRQVRDVVREQAATAPEDKAEIQTMAAEMKMLKMLVEQLSRPPRDAGPARSARDFDDDDAPLPLDTPAPRPAAYGMSDEGLLLDVVRDALNNERVDLLLQPIVSLPQRKLRFFECIARIRAADGTPIPAERYLPIAKKAGLVAPIDNMLLFRCVQHVRRMRRRQPPVQFFCNISSDTLNDSEFFGDFIGFMRENTDLAGHIVFELAQADVHRMDARTERELASLAKAGFRFSMDHVKSFDVFVSDLSQKGFRFLKVGSDVLLDKMAQTKGGDPRALKKMLDRGAIDLVVEGIDTEADLLNILDYAIDFGQGEIFGLPRESDAA